MISDFDETLKQLLTKKGNLNSGDVDISFNPRLIYTFTISEKTPICGGLNGLSKKMVIIQPPRGKMPKELICLT
jgi:hypothetical protein